MSKQLMDLFREKLLTNREEMEVVRNTMSNQEFGKLYGISSCSVISYMGQKTVNLISGCKKIEIDIERANELRKKYSDIVVGEYFGCDSVTV
jgi:hypothetical protein